MSGWDSIRLVGGCGWVSCFLPTTSCCRTQACVFALDSHFRVIVINDCQNCESGQVLARISSASSTFVTSLSFTFSFSFSTATAAILRWCSARNHIVAGLFTNQTPRFSVYRVFVETVPMTGILGIYSWLDSAVRSNPNVPFGVRIVCAKQSS